jgi:hypothetical protein
MWAHLKDAIVPTVDQDSDQAVTLLMSSPEEAHQHVTELYRNLLKPMTARGKVMQVTACEAEDNRSVLANRYYWGFVLKDISEQGAIEGQRWAVEAWHELFKRQFLGYRVRKFKVAGSKRVRVVRELRSTTDLKTRAWHKYLDQLMAFAANELGVVFSSPPAYWSQDDRR